MIDEELEAIIRAKYQEGLKRDAIKLSLLEQGWADSQIEEAIAHIQRDAIVRLPIISHVYQILDHLEQKTAQASYKTVAAVLAGSSIIVLILFAGLYIYLDPLGVKSADRDKQRETDVIKIRNAISSYYSSTGGYPTQLNALIPKYLPALPQDPKTGEQYEYKPAPNGKNYALCINFETQPIQCLSPQPSDTSIPVVVTPLVSPEITPDPSRDAVDPSSPSGILN